MPHYTRSAPPLRRDKDRDRAYVTLSGRRVYCGPWGTDDARRRYDRAVAEWLTADRTPPPSPADRDKAADPTIDELIARYRPHVDAYYRKPDGTPTSEAGNIRTAIRPLRRLYGSTPAVTFGPKMLKSVRAEMVRIGWCRTNTNKAVARCRSMFRWAASEELLPASIYENLRSVPGLKAGRSDAREADPVRPVDEATVEATLKYLAPIPAAMTRFMLLTGCRAGEMVLLRPCDLDTSGEVWAYKPSDHKTAHHGHDRVIYIPHEARELIGPYLARPTTASCFSPAEAEAARLEALHARRVTPMSYGNRPGTNRRDDPVRKPGDRYTTTSYRVAVQRAADRADAAAKREATAAGRPVPEGERIIERWHPHQMRHTAATRFRRDHGLEVARVLLGHRDTKMTRHYAEADHGAAVRALVG